MTKRKFLFNLSRSSYEKDWGTQYQRPGFRARLLATLLRLVPKSGPFKGLAFRAPTPEVEKMFMTSFNTTVDQYRKMLLNESADHLKIPNENFDTGTPTQAGKYLGADLAYDKLLDKLADKKFAGVSADLRDNMLSYYDTRKPPSGVSAPELTEKQANKKDAKARAAWQKTTGEIEQLRQYQIPVEVAATQ